jgi:N-acetylglucosaminyldiphosphoundecaprenol N-acetyl-beta-D-mannosaminyltransferase
LSELPDSKLLITTINAHSYNVARRDAEFARALQQSDILLPDGISVVFATRFLVNERIRKVAGEDLFLYEMNRLNAMSGTCFFLGSSDNILEKIKKRASFEYPNVKVHTFSPPYKAVFSDEDTSLMIERINQVKPDVLFIGMTAPKQEKWAYHNFMDIDTKHVCCIGAVFDFYAGTYKRAPHWIINLGLEWLYRLIQEPRRMWRRYVIGNAKFIRAIFNRDVQNANHELTLSKLSETDRIILLTSHIKPNKATLHKLRVESSLIRDWSHVDKVLISHGCSSMFYRQICNLPEFKKIDKVIVDRIISEIEKDTLKNEAVYQTFSEIITTFNKLGIDFITLKGVILAKWLYEDVSLRKISEIELLLPEKDLHVAVETLKKRGFALENNDFQIKPESLGEIVSYPVLVRNNIPVKLFVRLHGASNSYKIDIDKVFKKTEVFWISGTDIRMLSLYDMLIHLCVNFHEHFITGYVELKAFFDIVGILDIHAEKIKWDEFISRCKTHSCEEIVMKYIVMAHEYCNAPVPESICKKYIVYMSLNDERLFYQYLKCEYPFFQHTATHFQNIKQIRRKRDRLRYSIGLIFPPVSFMVKKYRIPVVSFAFLWYPYRWIIGLVSLLGLLKILRKK